MSYPTKIELCDGKYTVIYDLEKGISQCLRYGEPWRELCGDKMVLALFDRVVELEAEAVAFKQQLTDKGTIVEAALQTEIEALKAELERYKARAAAMPPQLMPVHAQLQDPDPEFWFGEKP